jgi:23S rRNA (adenine-N6)-dimethyltransferase
VDRLLAESSIESGDLLLDLGAGAGVIAESLANHDCRMIAVEEDAGFASHLRKRFAQTPRVHVSQRDLMDVPLPLCRYRVFYILLTSPPASLVDSPARNIRPKTRTCWCNAKRRTGSSEFRATRLLRH